jgi:hypothetical protein
VANLISVALISSGLNASLEKSSAYLTGVAKPQACLAAGDKKFQKSCKSCLPNGIFLSYSIGV